MCVLSRFVSHILYVFINAQPIWKNLDEICIWLIKVLLLLQMHTFCLAEVFFWDVV